VFKEKPGLETEIAALEALHSQSLRVIERLKEELELARDRFVVVSAALENAKQVEGTTKRS
jgi:hypothetical protein